MTLTVKGTHTHARMYAYTHNPRKRRRGGRVSESRNAVFGDASSISLFVLFMEREVKVWKSTFFCSGFKERQISWKSHLLTIGSNESPHAGKDTTASFPSFFKRLHNSCLKKCTSRPHSSQRWHPRFPMNLCIVTHSLRSAAWSLRNSEGCNMGFLHPRGVCSHDENGRAGSGGEHLVLMSWPRERGHSQIPGLFLGHAFFLLLPDPFSPCKGRAGSREPHFVVKVSEDMLTNFKVFLNPLQSRCTYGVRQPHRQKLIELENHSGKTARKKPLHILIVVTQGNYTTYDGGKENWS